MINLRPSEEQGRIVAAVADFLREEMPADRLRSVLDPAVGGDRALWPALGAFGIFGLGLPETAGGAGFGIIEETLVFRELGLVLASPSMISTAVGAHLALASGNVELARNIVAGKVSVGLAIMDDHAQSACGPDARFHLIDGDDADLILVWDESGAGLATPSPGSTAALECIDWTIALSTVSRRDFSALSWVERERFDAPNRIRLLTAAVQCGLAQGAMDLGVDHVKLREQFGQPLGAFQAVKHRCADMAKHMLAAWSQTCFAAVTHSADADQTEFQTLAAAMLASDAAVRNAEASIQNFGAIGFTAENLVHLYLKRAHVLDLIGGGRFWQQRRFMALPNPVLAA